MQEDLQHNIVHTLKLPEGIRKVHTCRSIYVELHIRYLVEWMWVTEAFQHDYDIEQRLSSPSLVLTFPMSPSSICWLVNRYCKSYMCVILQQLCKNEKKNNMGWDG